MLPIRSSNLSRFAPSYFLIFLLIIYVRPEIVQTVLKIGPYRQPKLGGMREKQYLCIVSSNSENYAVKLLVKCRQTIRNIETRKIEPKTMKHSYSKSELATMAGVSYSTFYRYLKTRRSRFNQMGLSIYAKKLPLSVVKDICDDYCFDL